MKIQIWIFSILFLCSCISNNNKEDNRLKNIQKRIPLALSSDSGYISGKEGLSFLVSQSMIDSSEDNWKEIKAKDTIGKYYKLTTENYLVCFMNYDSINGKSYNILFEIEVSDNSKKIISKEKFLHSNYPCCWVNDYEGFRKINDFFYLKTCVTGSAYCGQMFYLFKKLHPQDSLNYIYESYRSEGNKTLQSLNSDIDIKDTTLQVHYVLRDGKTKHGKDYFNNDAKKFTVKYKYINDNWFASDSTNIKDLDF